MKVLVLGGGAREHTILWKLSLSDRSHRLFAAPGNAGTREIAENLDIAPTDLESVAKAAREFAVDLVVVGPEAPLAAGIVDYLEQSGIPAFGPNREAARIESSKVFAKSLMHKYGIPCARDAVFSSYDEARDYIMEQPAPLVIKADGLAAGKGVVIVQTREEALKALSEIMCDRVFGDAGSSVLVEECLSGRETSLIAFTDGKTVAPLPAARDYKRVYEGNLGPNTGGMGAYSPPDFFDSELSRELTRTILEPTVRAMASEGRPYRGMLYAGLMLTDEGPKVLEYNARFGDPETQVQLPLLKSDLLDIMLAITRGELGSVEVSWDDGACVGVVLASGGYPGRFRTGYPISGLDKTGRDVAVFHAGTRYADGRVETAGGRVLTVVATGGDVAEARGKVMSSIPSIHFEGCYYRKDIAAEEVR
ncbi:MAG: phosphoribosylamine--glycine ligase [Dehalococcoidia bacterium]|nr:phosphoribosylamine--glycine ligase [Dehalococcoidia bacterium]